MPVADSGADVTFRCHTGDYILLVYGRLPLDRAVDTGRLEIAGVASRHPLPYAVPGRLSSTL